METTALECVSKVALIVGSKEDQRRRFGGDYPELGNRNLVGTQYFEQESLERLVALIHFVNQQNRTLFLAECAEQWSGFQKIIRKELITEPAKSYQGAIKVRRTTQLMTDRVFQDLGVE